MSTLSSYVKVDCVETYVKFVFFTRNLNILNAFPFREKKFDIMPALASIHNGILKFSLNTSSSANGQNHAEF